MRLGVRLGVDVGSVRVGVARCDPSALIATPVTTLARDEANGSDRQSIASMVSELAVIEVIVGNPVALDGRVGYAADATRRYAVALASLIAPVPVRLVDERLSTVAASRQLRSSGVRGRGHRRVIDQAAAVVVLQGALDAERATGRAPGSPVEPEPATDGPSSG
jgi:putative Holliday junction resolvase